MVPDADKAGARLGAPESRGVLADLIELVVGLRGREWRTHDLPSSEVPFAPGDVSAGFWTSKVGR